MSSIRLFILDSFARHGEMHGHQLRVLAEQEHVHLWTDITVGSIYGAMKRLATEGLLVEVRAEREGNRPERQVYAITGAGQEALRGLRADGLTTLIVRPDPFDLALCRPDPDRLEELPTQLQARLDLLAAHLEETLALNARAAPYLSAAEKLALQHREHRLNADLAWHRGLLEALPELITDETTRQNAQRSALN